MLITSEEFNNLKSRDNAPLECKTCNNIFYRTKHYIQSSTKRGRSNDYCSNECWHKEITTRVEVTCLQCGTIFKKIFNQTIKSPNHFCCHSCAATHHNTHKSYGYRRSKLEIYLEEQIDKYYPELKCKYNNKEIIGSELDFYFPTLRLAIELNGIFHYEPIYGQDKLEKIQNNDTQKSIRCNELNIEFCIIDASTCNYLNTKEKNKYWGIVSSLIDSVYTRHNSSQTTAQ